MSKIIIDNQTDFPDEAAVRMVLSVVKMGKVSGDNQYCWVSTFYVEPEPRLKELKVIARPVRGEIHSFRIAEG